MNPQYNQPAPNFQAPLPQSNYNGNQLPPNSLPNQMAGLSLNNDFSAQKGPPTQFSPPVSLQQQAYAGKPGMTPVTQQPNAPPVSRPPMAMNNNPASYATNGTQPNQAPPSMPPPSFNGSSNQYPSQPQSPLQAPPNPQSPVAQQNRPPQQQPTFAPPLPGQSISNGPDNQLRQQPPPMHSTPAPMNQAPPNPIQHVFLNILATARNMAA